MQEKNTQYEIDTKNKEHNETDLFFETNFYFYFGTLGLLSVTFLWGKASGKPFFFFTMWAYQIREGNLGGQKKQKRKQEARHNKT